MLLKNQEETLLERAKLLDLLQGHHRELGSALNEAEAAHHSLDPARAKTLALIRWQLMRRLRSYQLFKDSELFGPICRGSEMENAKSAWAMKARSTAIGVAFSTHVQKWSACGIESSWAEYEEEAEALIELIRQHLSREAAEAETLLLISASSVSLAARRE